MALTFKQGANSSGVATTPDTVTFPGSCTSGSFLVLSLLLGSSGGSAAVTGVTDPTNGAWTKLVETDFAASKAYIYYFPLNTATTALVVSVAFSGSATLTKLGVAEYTGQATAFGPVDTSAAFLDNITGTSFSGNPVTTISTNETVLAMGYRGDAGALTITGTNGFTNRALTGASAGSALIDAAEASQGTFTPTCTISGAGTELVLATVAVFSTTSQQAGTPTFSPVAGAYGPAQTVTITSSTAGGTIFYTTDGSTPTHGSSSISNGGTITVSATETVKALASVSTFVDSAVGSAAYTINGAVATSTFSPVAGTYTGAQSVTVSNANSALPGFAQYYTTDGSVPTTGSTLISGAISVTVSETLKVLAVATNYSNSAIASAAYVLSGVSVGWSPVDSRQAVKGFGPGANTGIVDAQGNTIYSAQDPPFTGNSQVSDNTAIPPVDSRKAGAPVDSRAKVPVNSRVAPPFKS